MPFALSGDGNTIVVGTSGESSSAGQFAGAIQVFTRDAQHHWSRQAFIQATVPVPSSGLGRGVATSHDGNRIVATTAGTAVANPRIYVFEREAGQWRQAHFIEERLVWSAHDDRNKSRRLIDRYTGVLRIGHEVSRSSVQALLLRGPMATRCRIAFGQAAGT